MTPIWLRLAQSFDPVTETAAGVRIRREARDARGKASAGAEADPAIRDRARVESQTRLVCTRQGDARGLGDV